jgi:hypothetical protein
VASVKSERWKRERIEPERYVFQPIEVAVLLARR